MPDSQKQMELDIEILGKLDPSVMATVNQVKTALASMGADARTRNEVMKRAYSQMFDGVNRGAKNMETVHKSVFSNISNMAVRTASKMHESFIDTFKEIGGEVGKGLGFGAGFAIPSLVGAGIERAKEFGGEAIDIRGEREALQTQLENILKSRGQMLMTPQIDTMLRNIEGREVPEKYADLLKATTLLFSSAPEKFATVDQLHKTLTQLADISRTPEAFSLATQAFTRMLAEGKVDAAHLRELAVDTGYNFKGAMADALKVSPEELSDMIKKKTLTGEQSLDALFGAFDKLTGPGGPAYQHAEAQLAGLKGLQARWQGHMEDLQESFGKQMENLMQPVMEEIFKHLTPAELTHAFDQWTPLMKGLGDSIAYLMESIAKGPSSAQIKGIADAISALFGQMIGAKGDMFTKVLGGPGGMEEMTVMATPWRNAIDNVAAGIEKTLASIRSTIQFVADHWRTIQDGMMLASTAWAGTKAYDFAKGLRDMLREVGIMSVQAGVVNVSGPAGAGVAGAVKEAEKVGAGAILPAVATSGAATVAGVAAGFSAMTLGGAIGAAIADRWHIVPFDPERDLWSKIWQQQKEAPVMKAPGLGVPGGGPSAEQQRAYQEAAWWKQPAPAAAAPAMPDLSGKTSAISTSITSIASALSSAPTKASEASGHLDEVASTFAGLPGKASSISGSLNSLVAAINSAVSSATASIHSAAASAAASLAV
jgi:hypothetical protein